VWGLLLESAVGGLAPLPWEVNAFCFCGPLGLKILAALWRESVVVPLLVVPSQVPPVDLVPSQVPPADLVPSQVPPVDLVLVDLLLVWAIRRYPTVGIALVRPQPRFLSTVSFCQGGPTIPLSLARGLQNPRC
jgi:hypothetical protein